MCALDQPIDWNGPFQPPVFGPSNDQSGVLYNENTITLTCTRPPGSLPHTLLLSIEGQQAVSFRGILPLYRYSRIQWAYSMPYRQGL